MLIKTVELKNFRSHAHTRLELSTGINVLVGDNAQGKTNVIEAVYMTCVGRGFRSARDKDVIKFGEELAQIKTVAQKKFGDIEIEITVGAGGKQIKINQIPIQKMGELLGSVTCVFFNPDELRLIKDAPADRRRFMDIDISQMDKNYFYNLLKYNKILKQRNALLKDFRRTESEMRSLDIWDEQLANAGAYIMTARRKFCEQLNKEVQSIHAKLCVQENINISIETVNGDFLANLRKSHEKDLKLKTTTVGIHRDDLLITINNQDVRGFASQGQQRTVALSMKIAEVNLFEKQTGERPILLLDDVFSELDANRRARLLDIIKNWQVIITTTDAPNINAKVFPISQKVLTKG